MASLGSAEVGLLSATGPLRILRAIEIPSPPYVSTSILGIVMTVRMGFYYMIDLV